MRPPATFLFAAAASLSACHSQTTVAPLNIPHAPTATTPPPPSVCLADSSEPFIFDWPSDRRGDLEVALKQKVVVLNVTCSSVRILPDCTADGEYRFVGMSPRESHISLRSADEVAANLPLAAAQFTGASGVDFAHGSSLDITYDVVGRRTTARATLQRSDLKGECAGATHFVRGATVGAFAIASGGTGPHAQISKDGAPEGCRGATADAAKEIAGCGAPVRIQLKAIREPGVVVAAPSPEGAALASCPTGMVRGEAGACERPTADRPHICVASDVADCALQCEHGSAASCAILGRSYEQGRGVPKDPARAAELLNKGCAGGAYPACGRLGEAAFAAHDTAKGVQLLTQACNGGWNEACRELGTYFSQNVQPGASNAETFRRGCFAGDAESCWGLGLITLAGGGVPRDEPAGAQWMELACLGGAHLGCSHYVNLVDKGRGVPADPARAVAILTTACDGGDAIACNDLSAYYVGGHNVPKDVAKGTALLERSCVLGNIPQCQTIAMRYEMGLGVTANPAKAKLYYSKACEAGITPSCAKVQGKP